eukprot:554475-Amphidinium_carterae.1
MPIAKTCHKLADEAHCETGRGSCHLEPLCVKANTGSEKKQRRDRVHVAPCGKTLKKCISIQQVLPTAGSEKKQRRDHSLMAPSPATAISDTVLCLCVVGAAGDELAEAVDEGACTSNFGSDPCRELREGHRLPCAET